MEVATAEAGTPEAAAPQIERGTYEIIRDRLLGHARTLRERADELNRRRLELFGSTELAVIGNERIRTENNCIPRDIVQVGGKLLFGYNVFLGLKRETRVEDVFSLHDFAQTAEGFDFSPVSGGVHQALLGDPRFLQDFQELYKFYKEARILALRHLEGGKVLAVFQIGAALKDVRVLRWAVSPAGEITYIDNRGERDHQFPPSHDFEWTATGRDHHVAGRHPHVNVLDEVFVETVGGDLTVKVEDNTEDGLGIYREPVEDAHQSLDDAEIHYARLGVLILLEILPYREKARRYLVFNTRTRQVHRIDAIGQSCVQLPEDHGIIFPGGYYLQSGETKTFSGDTADLAFKRVIRSPNGEDVLYLFYHHEQGRFVLLPYNMIRKEVANPIECHGFSLFDDGKMVIFRAASAEPTRVHPMQVWQTPFVSAEHAAQAPTTGSYLEKVGNAELVRGISDALSLCRAAQEQQPSAQIYEDLMAAATRVQDSYYWLGHQEIGDLLGPVREVRATAELIVDEFEKVEAIRARAREAVKEAEAELRRQVAALSPESWSRVDDFVGALGALRRQRGHLITLRELRYVDRAKLDALEEEAVEHFEALSRKTVSFLEGPEALAPYHERLDELEARIETVAKVSDARPIAEELEATGAALDLLAEVVAGLDIDDATVRTAILEGVSEVLGGLNRVRALLESRRKGLTSKEATAEFGVQFKLFGQSVASAVSLADTPEKCDEQMSRLMLQLEDLESRFSEFDEFLEQLATKREDVYEALGARKQRLLEQRQRRADQLMEAAERILAGLARRGAGLADEDALNTFFASDALVERLRNLEGRLRELGDSVRADEVASRLKAAREDAARGLRDRRDLFEEGTAVIKLGRHRFSVNTRELDLVLVPRQGGMAFHLTGTDFYQAVDDPQLEAARDFWQQQLVSETEAVYRGEYLAAQILAEAEEDRGGLSLDALRQAALADGGLLDLVRRFAAERYDEGYERGLHDHDAALILEKVLALYTTADLLRFAPRPRALAVLFWVFQTDRMAAALWQRRAASLARLRSTFAHSPEIGRFTAQLAKAVGAFFELHGIEVDPEDARVAGAYLFEEIAKDPVCFLVSAEASRLVEAFGTHLRDAGSEHVFREDLRALEDDLASRYQLVRAWLTGFVDEQGEGGGELRPALEGAVALLLTEGRLDRQVSSALPSAEVSGLLGQHPRIHERRLTLRLDEFLSRLGAFRHHRVPGFRQYQQLRHRILERERLRLRLDEFRPKVMSAFVRNRLIQEVYLPLIGNNLAKQMGALGEGKRTDQMGMLLLISPPGYGKTTLMEYVANRLGMVFLKINGPALGHSVRSLDPAEAPNATARQEVEKINLALEMANNVLLYLDDIQHTHPELLQKFISLCDAQRRIEGVWNGRTRTYDLRGKRFAVCMAGNPYTESGAKFQIPDMLANRADVYNLGDILEGKDDLFALSYLENALTSNPVLAPLTTRDLGDVYQLVRMARGEEIQADQLSHGYAAAELQEILGVLRKLRQVQAVLLEVNEQYIHSASQDDAYRTEPRFQLQGSYRNMNKLAEKVVAVMNDAELEALIDDHYVGESQTLTTGAEHNLLKLAELRGRMTPEQQERWQQIKRSFARVQAMGGAEDDPATRVVGQLGLMADRLGDLGRLAALSAERASQPPPPKEPEAPRTPEFDGPAFSTALTESLSGSLGTLAERLEKTADKVARGLVALAKSTAERAPEPAERIAKPSVAPPVAPPATDLAPLLQGLDRTLNQMGQVMTQTVAEAMSQVAGRLQAPERREIVQTLPAGVHEIMDRSITAIEESLMPAIRTLGRRVEASEDPNDRRLGDYLSGTLKKFDQLKDLLKALRKIDTRGVGE